VGYYFKLILAMYTKEPEEATAKTPFVFYAVAIIAIILNIIIGIFPSLVMNILA
jgi:NADH-quinone oxidoreductase subunit N